ncbi:glycolate oxidase subunit GlcE, partial [Bordetella pertussis]
AQAGGHATLFRAAGRAAPADGVFHPLSDGVAAITRRLKQELDPAGLFNPGRLVPEL